MIALKSDKLDGEIRRLIGNNKAMVADFRSVVIQIHRDREEYAVQRNCALRDIMAQVGKQGAKHGCLAGRLAQGRDTSNETGFDEMVEYAKANYPHLMQYRRGESDTGTAEEHLRKWVLEGIAPVPKPWDEAILQEALTCVGPQFFEGYEQPASAPVHENGLERVIVRLETYYDRLKKAIDDENNGAPAIGWPKYYLSRLRNEIARKIPVDLQDEVRARVKLAECEQMVREHFTCTAF